MNKGGGLTDEEIIIVIISFVFLLVMFFFISPQFENSEIENAISSCSTVFSQASSSTILFDGNSEFKDSFWRSVSNACSSLSTTIENEEVSQAAEHINNCWRMSNGDSDFLPSGYQGGVCMYCGDLKMENYQYGEFRGDLSEELRRETYKGLFETTSVTSLNSLLLSSNTFSQSQDISELGVVMYAYKGEFSTFEDLVNGGIGLSTSAASVVGAGGIAQEFLQRATGTFKETQKGIALVEYDEEKGPLVDGEPLNSAYQCEVIVPENDIEY